MESTFASRIRQYRQERGLSQQALAELCGLTQGNIAHMENGTEPKQSNVSKLVAGLPDLNPDWLLTGTGPMLRDGRALSPAPVAAAVAPAAISTSRPAPLETTDGQVDFVQRYISKLEADLEAERARVSQLLAMLGKPSGNLSYAAEPAAAYFVPTSAAPIGPRFDDCVIRQMWPDAGSAEVTPLRQAN